MTSEYDQVNLYSFTFVWLPLGMTRFVENCPYGKNSLWYFLDNPLVFGNK